MGLGAQFFCCLLGLFFLAIGGLFVFSALPHTDSLTLERRGDKVTAWKSQALAGRWKLNSSHSVFGVNTTATVVEHEDEGSVTYQTVLDGDGGRWYFGKSLPDRNAAHRLAERINRFLADPQAGRFDWQQKTWWWFLLPFGLIGVGVGLAVLAFGNHQDRWRFNQIADEVTCRRCFLLFWKTRRWPIPEICRAFVYRHTDKDGDTFNNIRLELQDGKWVEMCTASHQMDTTEVLEGHVDRINRFLGVKSQPVQVVDDRGPLPDPAEVEKQLQQLAATSPRLARLLGRFVRWAYRKRAPAR